jgi:predicted nucleotidyltransferase
LKDVIAERKQQRDEFLGRAASYVAQLQSRLNVRAAVVVGSVARGDFNLWSDIDVVVIAEDLPERLLDRLTLLMSDAPRRVQPHAFTAAEFKEALGKRNRLAEEAARHGVPLTGDITSITAEPPPT